MEHLADTIIDKGGEIKGIMPKFMNKVEWAHKRVADVEFTCMDERHLQMWIQHETDTLTLNKQ